MHYEGLAEISCAQACRYARVSTGITLLVFSVCEYTQVLCDGNISMRDGRYNKINADQA